MEMSKENSTPVNDDYKLDGTTYKETNTEYSLDIENNTLVQRTQTNLNVDPDLSKSNIESSFSKIQKNVNKTENVDDEEEEEEEEDEDNEGANKTKQSFAGSQKQSNINKQDMSQGHYGYEGDTRTFTDSTDGTCYFWDKDKKAWFPKIDDTFIAYYQMSYGFTDSKETSPNETPCNNDLKIVKKELTKEEKTLNLETIKRKATIEPPKWFDIDDKHNTNVYVSNLPLDITDAEFVDLMQKCGLVMKDIQTGKMKVKLYTDSVSKNLKGDALCTYIKKESVDLALNLLDGYDVRGHKIKVEKARFTMKGDSYDASLKPKKRRKKDKDKIKKMQERLFAWQPDKLRGERSKNERVVIIKNLFEPSIFDENLALILEYQQDIKEECSKCGAVKKVVIYDKHKDGVAQVLFKEAEAADACIQLLNNRWFGQRLITAETWDGKTKYKVQETPEEAEARLKKWEAFLNSNKETESKNKSITESIQTNDVKKNDDGNDSDGTRSSAGSGDETEEETDKK